MKAANRAYLEAHGLNPEQSLAMYRATRHIPWASSKDPVEAVSDSMDWGLGGYWSLNSKMAASYMRNLNIYGKHSVKELKTLPFGGLYKAEVPATSFPSPIGLGGMGGINSEYATVFNPETINKLRTASRIGYGWTSGLRNAGPQRETVLSEFYNRVMFPGRGKFSKEIDQKVMETFSQDELMTWHNYLTKDLPGGRSIGL